MDYPGDFPKHLQHHVDAAIHTAEKTFVTQKQLLEKKGRFGEQADQVVFCFIQPIFFAFALQAARASEEGLWTGERVRHAIDKYLWTLTHSAWTTKHPDSRYYYRFDEFNKAVKKTIHNSEEWMDLQAELTRVATIRSSGPGKSKPSALRQGHRDLVRSWMGKKEITSVKAAARKLGVSDSVLKSIMSNKGKMRYSQETLKSVLETITREGGDQSGDRS